MVSEKYLSEIISSGLGHMFVSSSAYCYVLPYSNTVHHHRHKLQLNENMVDEQPGIVKIVKRLLTGNIYYELSAITLWPSIGSVLEEQECRF